MPFPSIQKMADAFDGNDVGFIISTFIYVFSLRSDR